MLWSLTYDLQLHGHLGHQVRQEHRTYVHPRVTHLGSLQLEGSVAPVVHGLKVQRGSFLLEVGQAVRLAVVGQHQSALPSELVAPLDRKARTRERRRGVEPEATVQHHWLTQFGANQRCFTGHAQDDWRRREQQKTHSHTQTRGEFHQTDWSHWDDVGLLPLCCWLAGGARMILATVSSLLRPTSMEESQVACR